MEVADLKRSIHTASQYCIMAELIDGDLSCSTEPREFRILQSRRGCHSLMFKKCLGIAKHSSILQAIFAQSDAAFK